MKKLLHCLFPMLAATAAIGQTALEITQPEKSGIYPRGARIEFAVSVSKDNAPASLPVKISYRYPGMAGEETTNIVTDASGKCTLAIQPEKPGSVLVKARAGAKQAMAGAILGREEIKSPLPVPEDFASFWENEIGKLRKLPMEAKLLPVELDDKEPNKGKIEAYEFSINCTGPRPATGYIAKPIGAKPKSLPIIVIFQGAPGVRAWNSWYYGDRAISVSVSKFGLPNTISDEELKGMGYNHYVIHRLAEESRLSREDNIFKWMILRDLRVLQYAKSLPEWDGKTLIVNGESLGGAQSIAVGMLDGDATFICACVPALSDHSGTLSGRNRGWPGWWKCGADGKPLDKEEAAAAEVSRYFDLVNFLSLHDGKKELSMSLGLLDVTCPPDGIHAAYNSIKDKSRATLVIVPDKGHGAGNPHGGARIEELLPPLRQ